MNVNEIKEAITKLLYKEYAIINDFNITISGAKTNSAQYEIEINIKATQYEG